MVSQPDHAASSLALRGGSASALGVSSSSSSSHRRDAAASRSRRYNRSHAGGSASAYGAPPNEFPVFSHSGDVEIVVRVGASGHHHHENRYLLHRDTLTRCSGFFEASTSQEWSRARALPAEGDKQQQASGGSDGAANGGGGGGRALAAGNELARIGEDEGSEVAGVRPSVMTTTTAAAAVGTPRRRWRYELDQGFGEGDIPMLVQKEESTPTKSTKPGGGPSASTSSLFGGPPAATNGSSHRRTSSSTHSNHSFFRSVANLSLTHHHSTAPPAPPPTQAEQDLLRDYDNLFRIMYNYPPVLDGVNIADAYVQCKSLLTLADQYDALAVVGPRVDHHLLQFQSRLWRQIVKYPISYLRLGYLARSKVIFQEALVHVVGQWPAGERSLRAALPDSVLDIIEDKVDELEEQVGRVEGRLFRLGLTTRGGERVTPATSYLDWLAVSLFRQWLADNTTPAPPPLPPALPAHSSSDHHNSHHAHRRGSSALSGSRAARNGGGPPPSSASSAGVTFAVPAPQTGYAAPLATLGRTYRILGGAPGAVPYLAHDECKRFLKLTPELYSRDNLRRFEKRVDELKALAREVVRPLMGSGLELEMAGGGSGRGGAEAIGYLTCTRVGDRDLPWGVD